jgi:hypothetical protein
VVHLTHRHTHTHTYTKSLHTPPPKRNHLFPPLLCSLFLFLCVCVCMYVGKREGRVDATSYALITLSRIALPTSTATGSVSTFL